MRIPIRDLCSPSPPYLLRHGVDNWTVASKLWCTPAPFQLQDTFSLFFASLKSKGSVLSGYTVLLPAPLPPPFLLASISLFSVRLVFRLHPLGPGVNQYGHTGLLFHPMGSFFHYTLHSRWYPFFPSPSRCSIITFWCAPPPLPSILGANAMASRQCMTAGFMG